MCRPNFKRQNRAGDNEPHAEQLRNIERMEWVPDAVCRCEFPFNKFIEVGRRFLSIVMHGPSLSKRGPRGFEHNAARSARSQWIQAKKGMKSKRNKSRIEPAAPTVVRAPEIDAYRLRHGDGASILPGAPASVWPSKLTGFCLCQRGPTSLITCTSRNSRARLSKCSIVF